MTPRRSQAAAAAAAAAAAERGDEAAPAVDGPAAEPAAAPEAPAEAPAAPPPTAPPVEAPAEAPAPAAAPAKKKKKKRSRRRGPAPPAEISEYERTRMRNIAAGNKKLYSLGLIHPPPEVVADPEHSWWSERARTRVFFVSRLRRARAPAGPVVSFGPRCHPPSSPVDYPCMYQEAPPALPRAARARRSRPAPRPR